MAIAASNSAGTFVPNLRHFGARRLHSLTGLIFGGYLIVHLIVNATLLHGGRAFQVQVDKLESVPLVRVVEWVLIYLPSLYHTAYGTVITVAGRPNVQRYVYMKNWLCLLQRISGVVIAAFLVFHVLSLRFGFFGSRLTFDTENATFSIWRHMNVHWTLTYVVYPIGIAASCFHLANGYWTAAITWGLTVSDGAQRRWGWMCTLLFIVTFVLGMAALVALARMPRPQTHADSSMSSGTLFHFSMAIPEKLA
jgi:succinate dehydrogenase / fumarate reductase cytochrome b subunit